MIYASRAGTAPTSFPWPKATLLCPFLQDSKGPPADWWAKCSCWSGGEGKEWLLVIAAGGRAPSPQPAGWHWTVVHKIRGSLFGPANGKPKNSLWGYISKSLGDNTTSILHAFGEYVCIGGWPVWHYTPLSSPPFQTLSSLQGFNSPDRTILLPVSVFLFVQK